MNVPTACSPLFLRHRIRRALPPTAAVWPPHAGLCPHVPYRRARPVGFLRGRSRMLDGGFGGGGGGRGRMPAGALGVRVGLEAGWVRPATLLQPPIAGRGTSVSDRTWRTRRGTPAAAALRLPPLTVPCPCERCPVGCRLAPPSCARAAEVRGRVNTITVSEGSKLCQIFNYCQGVALRRNLIGTAAWITPARSWSRDRARFIRGMAVALAWANTAARATRTTLTTMQTSSTRTAMPTRARARATATTGTRTRPRPLRGAAAPRPFFSPWMRAPNPPPPPPPAASCSVRRAPQDASTPRTSDPQAL